MLDLNTLDLLTDAAILCKQKLDSLKAGSTENVQERYRFDPLGFVMAEWPWGEKGTEFEFRQGPDALQTQFLIDLGKKLKANNFDGHTPVPAVRMAISSAHGTGKSTLGAWIAWFILRTRPMSLGTVTAGTFDQLEHRTWADIMYWGQVGKGKEFFDIQKSGIYHKDPSKREKWMCSPKTASKERAQSFAGQHAAGSTSWFLFDESSEVPDENWTPAYFGMTDGEPMFFAWGQMLRNTGEFHNITYGKASELWDTRTWSGLDSRFTNKQFIKECKEEWGEDSDLYRVRVLGLSPNASELQFISQRLVNEARARTHRPLPDEPLVVGFDAANGGMARYVFAFRRGLDAKSIPPVILPGHTPRDQVVAKMCDIMADRTPGRKVAALFGDQAFGSVIIQRAKDSGFTNCFEVNFGETSTERHYKNVRSCIWDRMREWLNLGAIPDDEKLAQEFLGPGANRNDHGKLVLESKESMAKQKKKSPDFADALACTFYRKVAPPPVSSGSPTRNVSGPLPWAR